MSKRLDQTRIDRIAAAIAEADSADYWVPEITDWETSEEWKREAYPDEYPSSAYEDRERYRKQARAALLALEPETDQELQDRIEVLEKNLAYEVAQKIKLAEQLQAATTTSLTLEQARWKMHAGIDSRCSEEVAAKAKPVIDLVLSSFALEPEAREEAEYFRDGDGDLWKFTDKGEWFHEEEPGEFRQVLSIDAEDQTLTPVGHAELAHAPKVTDAEVEAARAVITALAPYNMELRPDGSEDREAAAYVSGVQAASDAIPEALRAAREVE